MSEKLRVLVVEDNPADVDLIREHMSASGRVSFQIDSVSRLSEAIARLEGERFDLLLIDLGLPDSRRLETFYKLRNAAPNTPAIILTGHDDEETAIAAVRNGAQDYLIKGDITGNLLIRAAQYAMERKRAEAELQERESKLKTLFDLLPVGVSIIDAQRKISFSNSALERILEISKEGLRRGDYKSRTYLRPDGTPMPIEEFASERAMAEQKAVHDVETGVVKEDGTVIWTSVSAVPTAFPDWKAVIVTADITERKQAEILERAVYDIARAPETAKSLDDLYQSVHLIIKGLMPAANFYVALYDDKEDLLTFPYYVDEIDPVPPSRKPSNGLTEYVLRTGSTLLCDAALEKELLRRGEAKRFGSPSSCWLAVPLKAGNSTFGVIALDNYSDPKAYGEREKQILEYVSGQVANAIVRKQAEEILRRTEENFRRSLDDSPLGVRIISTEGETLYANQAMLNIYGYASVEELRLTPIQKRYTPESHAEFKVRLKQRRRERAYLSEYEVNIVRKSGEVRNLYVLRKEIIWNGEIQYQAVYQDITDRKLAEDKLQKTITGLEKAFGGIIQVLSAAVEKRDPYTAGHERRVAALARAIGLEMGLSKDRLNALGMAGSIHDVGKLSIPAEILSKPGQLAPFEYKLIQAHPQAGHDILKEIDFPWPIADMILQHHERMNGSGYPAGLKGDDILLEARILAVADVMEAMASHRPYRPALGIDAAMKEIEENRGILYDSDVTAACLTLFQQKGFSFEEMRSDSREQQAAFLLFAEDKG